MKISQDAFNLIVQEETGGEAYYDKTEASTDWPGGSSGVTIGIGYDCGYETSESIAKDWSGNISAAMIKDLQTCAGVTGSPARSLSNEFRGTVIVPWNVALAVFEARDVPNWEGIVASKLPNTDKLSGDSFGALVSLAFNRGASFDAQGDRYREMRLIKHLMQVEDFAGIPAQFLAMRRLWPNVSDLRNRRVHEADLFQKGLGPSI
jgi:hypothetical protein